MTKTKRVYAKALKSGDRIKFSVEGTWRPWETGSLAGHGRVVNTFGETVAATTDLSVVDKVVNTPDWKPGDVALVRFYASGEEYTYVRDKRGWPGKHRPLTDDEMDRLYADGSVRHVPAETLKSLAKGASLLSFGAVNVTVPYPPRFTGRIEEYR